jgi:hypothetical protein
LLEAERNQRKADAQRANKEKVNANNRAWYAANIETERQRNKTYRSVNRDKVLKRDAEKREANRDKIRGNAKRWRDNNLHRARELARNYGRANKAQVRARSKKWRKDNRDKVKDQSRAWYLANIEKAFLKDQKRRARKASLPDTLTLEQWRACINYFGGVCAACGRPPGLFHTLAMDHFIPLSSPDCKGTTADNCIPLCHGDGGCNNSKSNRDALTWAVAKFGKRKGKQFIAKVEAYFASLSTD